MLRFVKFARTYVSASMKHLLMLNEQKWIRFARTYGLHRFGRLFYRLDANVNWIRTYSRATPVERLRAMPIYHEDLIRTYSRATSFSTLNE